MPESPIQVVLSPDNYQRIKVNPPGGKNKDFFQGSDGDFAVHRSRLLEELNSIDRVLANPSSLPLCVVKVTLHPDALAKSHRPVKAVIPPSSAPVVGALGFGDILFRASRNSLSQIASAISEAELDTRWVANKKSDKMEAKPSRKRSETGAIKSIKVMEGPDKRSFSASQAVEWLADRTTGSGYRVDLFQPLAPREQWDTLDYEDRVLQQSFVEGLISLGLKVRVQPIHSARSLRSTISITLEPLNSSSIILYSPPVKASAASNHVEYGLDPEQHERLLRFLDFHPLVRSVRLPGKLRPTEAGGTVTGGVVDLPTRLPGSVYPKVGIIDGGTSGVLSEWVLGAWSLLTESHKDPEHGTFIGGLLVAGEPLNGIDVVVESGSCDIIDIAIRPKTPEAFAQYFQGISGFFDEMEYAIQECKAKYGVRVFNFSLNIERLASSDQYSEEAARLDQISDDHDVLLFVSAGNLPRFRQEWSDDPLKTMGHIAAARNDGIYVPAESVRNVSVGALNSPVTTGLVAFAPASYTRRGPGPGATVKPDLALVGGSGTRVDPHGSGLFSIDILGNRVSSSGTSYATPIAAKIAANLDHIIEGEVSRETLKALLIHNAVVPEPVRNKAYSDVARHLVGFGQPPSSFDIVNGNSSQITLVFSSRLHRGNELIFPFQWPQSLVRDGKCYGSAKATLVYTPPLDYKFGSEYVRVNLEAAIRQEKASGDFKGEVHPVFLPDNDEGKFEYALIEHGLKWSPVKIYARDIKNGIKGTSNWKLVIDSLERAEGRIPPEGIPFTCIVTIMDPDGEKPIFNEMRQSLQAVGVQIEKIQTAARITTRV